MTVLARETERYYHIEPMCRRWRPVNPGRYGVTRLVCHKPRLYGHGPHHESSDGWCWKPGRTGVFTWDDQPWRLWYCHGDAGRCTAKLTASYDKARMRGWRIWWRDGQLDPHCPACAKPAPELVTLCRDLERSVRR